MACQRSMCASGAMAQGVLISNLKIPGLETLPNKKYRFLENNFRADNANQKILDLYNFGLKLNNHLYCIPKSLADDPDASADLKIYKCQ